VAVDWSGAKKTGTRSGIWLAEIRNGRLTHSEPASTRDEAVAFVEACVPPVVAGFDFSFGVPQWFAEAHGCPTIDRVWSVVEREGEQWLGPPPVPPFWNARLAVPPEQQFRRCEERLKETYAVAPKSVFQLVGNGQVGAGSVRGMPFIARLKERGFSVWPFDAATERTGFEIYPSLLRKLAPRHDVGEFTNEHERDAVVSARVMWEHRDSFAALQAATDPVTRLEGDVWVPER
jgi:hypothetical protein